MSNASRSPTDLVKGIGEYRPTFPFVYFWEIVWYDSGLFWVVAPLFLWLIIGGTCLAALVLQKMVWISRFSGVGAKDSGHNLQSLPSVLNPGSIWFFALISSIVQIAYYYYMATLWANTGTAFRDIPVFVLQICAATSHAIFIASASYICTINLIECMNYRDSSHKAPEPPEIKRSSKHPSQKQVEAKRSLWKERVGSSELASGPLTPYAPVDNSLSHDIRVFHNTATRKETAVVAIFSTICALAAVLSDLTVMEMSSVIKIETVVATNFELVWKDSIASLGQVHNCYGYMNSYENVLKSFGIRDLLALTGLLIAFGWMSSAVNVFLEFSGTADLPSRLVNDAGRMSFVSACVIIALLFVRLTFYLLWAASNVTVFWMSVFSSGANPIFIMPHMPCLPAIGLSIHMFSALVILMFCIYLIWKERLLNEKVSFASALRYSRLLQVDLKACNLWIIPNFVTDPQVILCITEIDVSYNSIFFIKDSIWRKFGQIRSLNLSSNSFFHISPTVSAMKSLHCLDLSHNSLRSLPFSLRECILLTTLKLGSNNFSHFPEVILKMNLIELEIDHNFLKELPLALGALQTLTVFICCNNKLSALPPTFPDLRSIKQCDIRDNMIEHISLEVLRMPIMTVLTVWGNPCEHVKRIESGDLEGLPDEWRVALPQLLAAGNPTRTKQSLKSK